MSIVDKGILTAAWESSFAQLGQLKQGWNGYGAPPPGDQAIVNAKGFVEALLRQNYEPMRLAPSAVGGVGVTHRQGQKKVYVEFYNDGRILALFADDDCEPAIKRVEAGAKSFEGLVAEMRDYLDG